eukprot:CAMPEP_0196740590 /NCGR_PEP_ID=MMETSP1091-20130531/33737_1 /TAXON_ID=302021 /ORGANISM="Rhodomonas sp., Strain CCMP768" /LENGTH=174 /DNA_ID=CAMNT_0042085823 /DNA_START=9 /DNA_END=533 /DNA_ORIENTATION=-
MPKKGGKRLADIDADGQPAGDGKPEDGAESAAEQPQEEANAEPEKVSEITKAEEPKEEEAKPEAPAAAAAKPASPSVAPTAAPAVAPQTQRQKQASAAWEQQNKTAEKFYTNVFQGVEKDVQSVNSSLQANTTSAQDTLRNVSVANKLLWQISESLRSVDTLVVPIVLQRDGNF